MEENGTIFLQNNKKNDQEQMPKEDRRIIFEFDEAYKAIYAMSVQREIKKPPAGMITSIKAHLGDDNKVMVHLENPMDNSEASVEYSRDFLAAALMLYCRGLGIPLPKNASKSVMLNDERIALRVQI